MNKKALVYTVDDDLECLLQLETSLKSVRRCSKETLDVYILTDSPRPWMQDMHGAKVVDVSDMVKKYGLDKTGIVWRKNPVPPMLLFRLLIPMVEELKPYEQVMYLDTDTEVWSPEFFDIFDRDSNCEVIAVKDNISHNGAAKRLAKTRANGGSDWKDAPGIYNRWDEMLYGTGKYANSGVLVFNMKNLRDGYEPRIEYIMEKVKVLKPYYSDQDTLNAYFKVFVIDDRRYNSWMRTESTSLLRHYVGNDRRKFREYPKITDCRPNVLLDGVASRGDLGMFSGIVDRVYVLADSANPDNMKNLEAWLGRNGVKSYMTLDTTDTGMYAGLLDTVPHDGGMKPEHMENWAAHYKVIVNAAIAGCGRIAVFEDTFTPYGLEDQLPRLEPDFDLAICDRPGSFRRGFSYRAVSSKGYIAGSKCMLELRRLFETLWDPSVKNKRLRYVHKWLSSDVLTRQRVYVRA